LKTSTKRPRFYFSPSTNPLTYIESELCKWAFPDLFDALNLPVISIISPYLQALVALLAKTVPIFEDSEHFCPRTTALNYSQNFFQGGVY
jgi:hypothetical protein